MSRRIPECGLDVPSRAAGTARYVARDVGDGADMVLHVGDISYANGDGAVWDSFMDAIEPASEHVPYMVAVGAPPSHTCAV